MKIPSSWLKMESEHTKSMPKQRRIVLQHIQEHGKDYYPALKKMERMLDKKSKKA
jgi:hypothetical protein